VYIDNSLGPLARDSPCSSVVDVYLTNPIDYIMKFQGEVADFLKSLLAVIMPVVSIKIWGVSLPFQR